MRATSCPNAVKIIPTSDISDSADLGSHLAVLRIHTKNVCAHKSQKWRAPKNILIYKTARAGSVILPFTRTYTTRNSNDEILRL